MCEARREDAEIGSASSRTLSLFRVSCRSFRASSVTKCGLGDPSQVASRRDSPSPSLSARELLVCSAWPLPSKTLKSSPAPSWPVTELRLRRSKWVLVISSTRFSILLAALACRLCFASLLISSSSFTFSGMRRSQSGHSCVQLMQAAEARRLGAGATSMATKSLFRLARRSGALLLRLRASRSSGRIAACAGREGSPKLAQDSDASVPVSSASA
mmetsp:Transcript_17952/g.42656  ORF Transcript_17952/g.42656 Transcript_17952/m.42656 type:complete len:215 (-) Transcript_17952:1939-2583(-)